MAQTPKDRNGNTLIAIASGTVILIIRLVISRAFIEHGEWYQIPNVLHTIWGRSVSVSVDGIALVVSFIALTSIFDVDEKRLLLKL